MDRRFDKTHAAVFGPAAVMSAYWSAVATILSLNATKKSFGSALAILFNDPEQLRELDLPEWHAVSP